MAELFDFTDYKAFLRASQRKHPVLKRAITTEEWAQRLGFKSPRSVAMIIKGQRYPSPGLTEAISADLKLNTARRRYFELLVLREKNMKEGEKIENVLQEMDALNHKVPKKVLNDRSFSLISDWQNLVLRQLVETESFQNDAEWISQRLRGKVSAENVQKAIDSMVENGFLEKKADGTLIVPGKESLWTTTDVPSLAIRRHHAQMMQRAVDALVEQDVSNREFASATLLFNTKRLEEAKEAIRDFQESFNKNFGSEASERVYQLSIQFFEHTSGPLDASGPDAKN